MSDHDPTPGPTGPWPAPVPPAPAPDSGGPPAQQYRQQPYGWPQPQYPQPPYPQPQYGQSPYPQPQYGQPQYLQAYRPQPPVPGGGPARRGIGWGGLIALAAAIAVVAGGIGALVGAATQDRSTVTPPPAAPTPGGAFASPQSIGTVAAALLPSVVQIRVVTSSGAGTGSGFVLSTDGLIATNNHVVAAATKGGTLKVQLPNATLADATVVGRSPSYDIAVIRVLGQTTLKPVHLGNSGALRIGDPVVAIGSPLGLSGTVTSGIISADQRPVTTGEDGDNSYISALQTDAAINPGNSGGPLANLRGEVIGVNSAIATLGTSQGGQSGSIGLGFSIPINTAKRIIDEIVRTGHAVYPVIGADMDSTYTGEGARLESVARSSPAARAGLAGGDVVSMIDGHVVTSYVDLIVKVRDHRPGDTVRLTVTRSGSTRTLSITLGSQQG